LRFAGATGSSIFFGRPPLRLIGAGGSEETTAGASMVAAVPLPHNYCNCYRNRKKYIGSLNK
jgi:hypothetical protein